MKTSILHPIHLAEAKEVREYYGWQMPAVYTSVEAEYDAAKSAVALIDRSYFGRIRVGGRDKLDLLHRMSTNDLLAGGPDQASSTVFTTEKGRMVDYVRTLHVGDSLMLITSPGNEDTLTDWIGKYTIMEDILQEIITPSTSQISLIGPQTRRFAAELFRVDVVPQRVQKCTWSEGEVIVSVNTDFHTEIVDIIVYASHGTGLWKYICGRNRNIVKMGSIAHEGFRISHGIPAPGHEISERFNPLEAGARHAVSFTKGCYIGQEVIARLDTYQKVNKRLIGVLFPESAGPLMCDALLMGESSEVGVLTSVTPSPIHGHHLATAVVRMDSLRRGDPVYVHTDGRTMQGTASDFPIL